MMYALFKDGKQISKAHTTESVVWIEAYEKGAVISSSPDFVPDDAFFPARGAKSLADGYEIRPLSDSQEG